MSIYIDASGSGRLLPKGEYKVVLDRKVIGKFGSLMEAQNFHSTLGKRGSRIIAPNLRAKMTQDEINIAQNTIDEWGKWDIGAGPQVTANGRAPFPSHRRARNAKHARGLQGSRAPGWEL